MLHCKATVQDLETEVLCLQTLYLGVDVVDGDTFSLQSASESSSIVRKDELITGCRRCISRPQHLENPVKSKCSSSLRQRILYDQEQQSLLEGHGTECSLPTYMKQTALLITVRVQTLKPP